MTNQVVVLDLYFDCIVSVVYRDLNTGLISGILGSHNESSFHIDTGKVFIFTARVTGNTRLRSDSTT